jgi:hypothetical protein
MRFIDSGVQLLLGHLLASPCFDSLREFPPDEDPGGAGRVSSLLSHRQNRHVADHPRLGHCKHLIAAWRTRRHREIDLI